MFIDCSLLASSQPAVHFRLSGWDMAIIAFPVVLAFGITIYMRRFTRSVSDYLAAGRSAGRYLISTAQMEMGMTAIGVVSAMEVFSQTGFSLNMWNGFIGFFYFLLAMSGVITYRFRETRALTFHQFFEKRYSKGFRVFATVVNILSGLFTMGVGPAIAARFFVYYLGMDPVVHIGTMAIPTMLLVMLVVTAISLYFAFAGGHLTIMTTDAIEGVISSFLYLVVAFAILWLFSYGQMGEALASGKPGESYLDPFDIANRPNFNYVFILLGWAMTVYIWRGNAWNASFAASAKSAHEGQMAVVLGIWRSMASVAMGGLIGLGAFTLMHHGDFAGQREAVASYLDATITNPEDVQLKTQLVLPTALGVLLPVGVKGALCAVLFMGLIAGTAASLHGFSSGLVQDVVLPFTKKRLEPSTQIRILRWTAVGIALYSVTFAHFFRFKDYIIFVTQLLGALYLGGVGIVVWGGLYWKRGTTAAAWAAMVAGLVLAGSAQVLQLSWTSVAPWMAQMFGTGAIGDWMAANATKFPANGQIIAASIYGVCFVLYVVVSLTTCTQPYNMDALLHRGAYQVPGENKVEISKGFRLSRFAGVNENFSQGDRRMAYFTFFWGLTPNICNLVVVIWNLGFAWWTWQMWWRWHHFWAVTVPVVGGVITTIWFTWGVAKDLRFLFRDLETERVDDTDDGQFRDDADTVKKTAAARDRKTLDSN